MKTQREEAPKRAIVLGGSLAGMLAAHALREHFGEVVIVERDELPSEPVPRRAVPQGHHVHGFLPGGLRALEALLPGIGDELCADGAVDADLHGDAQWCIGGHRFTRAISGMRVVAATRPFIEHGVRRRVVRNGRVQLRARTEATSLELRSGRVVGVRVRPRDAETDTLLLAADLVVDASGRASRLPHWLREHSYTEAPEEELRVDIGYASAFFRPTATREASCRAVLVGATPEVPRSGLAQHVEGGLVHVGVTSYGGKLPSTLPELLTFAESLARPELHEFIKSAEAVTPIREHRVPRAFRRRYEALTRFPEGLLVMGDTVCALNPTYAQGMSVAAMEALALMEELRVGLPGVEQRYLARLPAILDAPWRMGLATDLAILRDKRRTLPMRFIERWMERVQRAAGVDDTVAAGFLQVVALLVPPERVLSPRFVFRVLAAGWRAQRRARLASEASLP